MSEQVRRVWISTRAHDRATGEWLTVKGEVVPTDDYAALRAEAEALRAENERLRNAPCECGAPVGYVSGEKYAAEHERLRECRKERDAARAQLTAIQGGMGEDVVVLATVSMGGVEYGIAGAELGDIDIQPDMKALCALQQSLVTGEDDAYVELIDKAQHQRITAAMAAEVERLRADHGVVAHANLLRAQQAEQERDALRAELAELQERASEEWQAVKHDLDVAREELAEVKGREAVARVAMVPGADFKSVDFFPDLQSLPIGTKLYTIPPASPDVEGLKNAARYEWLRDHYHGFEHYRKSTGTVANLDREIDEQIAALSTWRQSHP